MLLNYLYANFYEEKEFLDRTGITAGKLAKLMQDKVIPKPSYVLGTQTESLSFIGRYNEQKTYHFHLKGHAVWLDMTDNLGIATEDRAKAFFQSEYKTAAKMFFSGHFGAALARIIPDFAGAFDQTYFEKTWGYFTDGVYGCCTRDGLPASIFLKQALVIFIDEFTRQNPEPEISQELRKVLEDVVALLDGVESDFAPHEVSGTSRQRCIVDIKEKYLLT